MTRSHSLFYSLTEWILNCLSRQRRSPSTPHSNTTIRGQRARNTIPLLSNCRPTTNWSVDFAREYHSSTVLRLQRLFALFRATATEYLSCVSPSVELSSSWTLLTSYLFLNVPFSFRIREGGRLLPWIQRQKDSPNLCLGIRLMSHGNHGSKTVGKTLFSNTVSAQRQVNASQPTHSSLTRS